MQRVIHTVKYWPNTRIAQILMGIGAIGGSSIAALMAYNTIQKEVNKTPSYLASAAVLGLGLVYVGGITGSIAGIYSPILVPGLLYAYYPEMVAIKSYMFPAKR